jgi:hypothetical protein
MKENHKASKNKEKLIRSTDSRQHLSARDNWNRDAFLNNKTGRADLLESSLEARLDTITSKARQKTTATSVASCQAVPLAWLPCTGYGD